MLPKSNRLKLLTGNPGKRAIKPARQGKVNRGLPECPERLEGAAREAWLLLSAEAVGMQMDYRVDALALEGACVAYKRAVDADAVLDREGTTFTSPNGYIAVRPEVAIGHSSWKLFKSFCDSWGFTPLGRLRLNVETAEDRKPNKFAELS